MDQHQGFPMFSRELGKDTAHVQKCDGKRERMEVIQERVTLVIRS